MAYERITEFRIGSVMGRGFTILMRNIVPFGILALVVTSPTYIYQVFVRTPGVGVGSVALAAPFLVIANLILSSLLTATVVYGTVAELRGTRSDFGHTLRRGVALLFPVIVVVLVTAVIWMLGFLALVIPGLILMCALWVVVPAAVVERPGIWASLKRSAALTKGYRWRIFGILVLLGVISGLVSALFRLLPSLEASLLLSFVTSAFVAAWTAVINAVGYHDLRVIKEGVSVDEIAAVFD